MQTMNTQVVKVHYAKALPIVILAVGLVGAVLNLMLKDWLALGVSALLIAAAVGFLAGPGLVVSADRVEVKNPLQITVRRVSINGFGDLTTEGDVLRRASDGRRIRSLRLGGARLDDRAALEWAIDKARGR